MTYSIKTTIARINYRINLLRERGEKMNMNLINALIREKRALEAQENARDN